MGGMPVDVFASMDETAQVCFQAGLSGSNLTGQLQSIWLTAYCPNP